ncbi:MAG: hypothetical protein WCJ39_04050 [bacterium]
MPISKQLDIHGKKVLLAGFWSHQNMGDELILLGNIKLLQQQQKQIYVVAHDPQWIKDFLEQSIDTQDITFLQELPRGIRSTRNYIRSKKYKQIKSFLATDTVIL